MWLVREDWKFEDFFQLTGIEEHALKKLVAAQMAFSYGDDKRDCYAHGVGGIHPFDPDVLKTNWTAYKAKKDSVVTTPQDCDDAGRARHPQPPALGSPYWGANRY